MFSKKARKPSYRAVLASVKVEMAQPRVAESVHAGAKRAKRQRKASAKESVKK